MPDENWTAMGKPVPWPEGLVVIDEVAPGPDDEQIALLELGLAFDPKRFTG